MSKHWKILTLSLLVGFSSCTPRVSKEQWRSRVPNQTLAKFTGLIICQKSDLYRAVGEPSKTQTLGDTVYLYWPCRDGGIQVECKAISLNAGGLINGKINDY